MSDDAVTPSPWQSFRTLTPARLALGRAGSGMPTDEVLRFSLAHARARDAVWAELDVAQLQAALRAEGWASLHLRSRADDRATYLRRPDLGRQLADGAAEHLQAPVGPGEIAVVIGDGLSALAVQRHALPLLQALRSQAPELPLLPLVTVATQARVALADEIGAALGARLTLLLIGERPGLSSPDSLGIYLTFAPRKGRSDAERNCISNIHGEGLSPQPAAAKAAWLAREALRRGVSGVPLKDDSDLALVAPPVPALPAGET
jgi:ethanolamine ammonia-lyase small subunit